MDIRYVVYDSDLPVGIFDSWSKAFDFTKEYGGGTIESLNLGGGSCETASQC